MGKTKRETINVGIGRVEARRGNALLCTSAIGSCIGIAAYDSRKSIGALAHVMLPGEAPKGVRYAEKTKYASNAIEAILRKMKYRGAQVEDIEIMLAGGGNVLQKKDDTVCRDNIQSVLNYLEEKNLTVRARALGGTDRRCLSLDVVEGIAFYSEGDGGERELWRAGSTSK